MKELLPVHLCVISGLCLTWYSVRETTTVYKYLLVCLKIAQCGVMKKCSHQTEIGTSQVLFLLWKGNNSVFRQTAVNNDFWLQMYKCKRAHIYQYVVRVIRCDVFEDILMWVI